MYVTYLVLQRPSGRNGVTNATIIFIGATAAVQGLLYNNNSPSQLEAAIYVQVQYYLVVEESSHELSLERAFSSVSPCSEEDGASELRLKNGVGGGMPAASSRKPCVILTYL